MALLIIAAMLLGVNPFNGSKKIKNFTDANSYCIKGKFLLNPAQIPDMGCFTLTDQKEVSGLVAEHELKIKRSSKNIIKFFLDNTELSSIYDAKSGNNYAYSSPYVVTEGTYSWLICKDNAHLDCPTQIDFLGDSADLTATSSDFSVSVCTGGENKGFCRLGNITSNHCKGKDCFE